MGEHRGVSATREYARDYMRMYRVLNPDRDREYRRRYCEKNEKKIRARNKQRYIKMRVIRLYTQGKSRSEIARILGLSHWNVSYRLRQCGVTLQRELEVRDNIRAKSHRDRHLHRDRV